MTRSDVVPAPPDAAASSLVRSTTIVFLGNVVARGLGFLFPVVVAHALDRAEFAIVYVLISTGFAVGELVLASFPTALTRALAGPEGLSAGPGRAGSWLASAIVGGAPLLLVSAVVGEVLAQTAGAPFGLITVVIAGLTLDAYYFATLRGLRRFGLLIAYRILANAAQLLLALLVLAAGRATITVMVVIYAGVYVLAGIVVELHDRPVSTLVRGSFALSRERLRALSRFAALALVSGTAYAAILGLDMWFVQLLAPAQVADYGAARTLAMPMTLVSFAVGIVLLPQVAGASAHERRSALKRALTVSAVFGALGVVAYAIAAPAVIAGFFPRAYGGAAPILPYMAAAVGLLGLYSIMSQWWMGIGRPGTPAATLVGGAMTAVLAHLALTSSLGGIGGAASTAIGATTAILLLSVPTVRSIAAAAA